MAPTQVITVPQNGPKQTPFAKATISAGNGMKE